MNIALTHVGWMLDNKVNVDTQSYIDQMKKIYVMDTATISKADLFTSVAVTLLVIACGVGFLWWVIAACTYLLRGWFDKVPLLHGPYWRKMFLALLIILLVATGSVYVLLGQLYDLMVTTGWASS